MTKKKQTFTPTVSFTGYPDDIKTHFTAGVESAPMPADFVELMRAKGLTGEAPVANEESTVDESIELSAEAGAESSSGKPESEPGKGESW